MKGKFINALSLVLVVVMASIMISASSCRKEPSSSSEDSLPLRSDAVQACFIDDSITLSVLHDYTGITFPEGSEIECAVREIFKDQPHYLVLEGCISVKINVPYKCKDQLDETLKKISVLIDEEPAPKERIFVGLPHESDKTYSKAYHNYTGVKHIDGDEYQTIMFHVYTVKGDSAIDVYIIAEETVIR